MYKLLLVFVLIISFLQVSEAQHEVRKKLHFDSYSDTLKILDGAYVHIWAENEWINVEKIDKKNNLVFRTILFKYNGKKPIVTEKDGTLKISSSDDKYFINFSKYEHPKFDHSIISGVQEETLSDSMVLIDPSVYGIKPVRPISRHDNYTLFKWEKNGWQYFSTITEKRVVGIYRIKHNMFDEGEYKGSSEGYQALDDHHFYWNGYSIYAEQQDLKYAENIIENFIGKAPPLLNATIWYNTPLFNNLSELKGKVVILYFWAKWCAPCRPNLPLLEYYYQKYKEQGLQVIGVHHYERSEKLKDFMSQNQDITFPICVADKKTIDLYEAGLSHYFLINKKGKIAKAFLEKISEEEIKKLLK